MPVEPNLTGLRCVGYVRVSSEGQIEGTRLDSQERNIREYVKARGGTLTHIYREEGQSGRSTHKRDEFTKMRNDAGKHKFDCLVVNQFERLNRNQQDAIIIKALLRKDYQIKVLSVTEPTGDDPISQLIERFFESLAEYFSHNLSANIKRATREIRENGKWFGSIVPIGYLRDEQDKQKIVIDPEKAPYVVMMFEWYVTGNYSHRDIANKLNEMGLRTGRDLLWTYTSVRIVLTNPVYIGKMVTHDTTYTASYKRVLGEPKVYQGGHEPLISEELFNQAQEMAKRRYKNRSAKPTYKDYLLQGLCYCSRCLQGEPPDGVPEHKHGKMYIMKAPRHNGGETYQYYRCPNGHATIQTHKIDEQIINFLLSDTLPDDWKTKAVHTVWEGLIDKDADEYAAEIKAQIDRLNTSWIKGFLDYDKYVADMTELQKIMESIPTRNDGSYERAVDLIYNFKKHWEGAGDDQRKRRDLVQMVVEGVYLDGDKVEAVLLAPGQKFFHTENGLALTDLDSKE